MSYESTINSFAIENDSEKIPSLINNENITGNGSLAVNRNEKLVILEIAILLIIFILIVFGNLCVLIALQVRKLKMNRMYYFLLHLCIADLIAAFFNVIPQLAWEITHRFYGGNFLCKTIKYLQILGPYLSSYVLVMTAIDRYQAICYPLTNCAWTPSRSKLMILIAWIISLLCCAPQMFIFSYQEIPGVAGVHDCWGSFGVGGERIYVTWYAVSVFIIPFIILTFTHVHICREIWLNLHKKRKSFKVNRNRDSICDTSNRRSDKLDNDSVNLSETSEQASGTRLLVTVGKSYRFKGRGQVEVSVEKESGKDYSPRTHSIHGLTRAKMKTVKITIVIIMCYIFCSSPFICVQLWAYWWPNAQQSPIWNGPIIAILMLLPSLNSCVNPWIYLYFNQNLVTALKEFFCRKSIDESNSNNETKRCKSRYNSQKENESQSSMQLSQLNNSSHRSRLGLNYVIHNCQHNSSKNHIETELI